MKDDHREEETRTAAGKAEQPKDPIAPAQRLGRYLVLSEVGRGAMGQVYAAYDPKLDRRVALKVLRGGDGPKERKRFLREAKALARISHPNVLTVHEVEEVGEQVIIALEFVSGGTLKDWLRDHPPGDDDRLREALELLVQAGKGLMAAHAEGLIHRDFKPSNVLVGHDGRVRVADFGLARRSVDVTQDDELDEARSRTGDVAVDPRVTQTGQVAGTPAYMAPEQWSGGELDARTDQFSFCVVAWEVLFGERPYGPTAIAGPPATSEVRRPQGTELPAGLDAALRKGLSVRPAGRFRAMNTLIEELETGLDALLGRNLRRGRRRGWKLLGAGVLVATSVWGFGQAHEARLVAKCEALGARTEEIWNEDVRAEALASLRSTREGSLVHDEDRLSPWLDKQAAAMKEATVEVCRHRTVEKDWDAELADKAEWCVDERRFEFELELEGYREGTEEVARRAVDRALELKPLAPCLDPLALAALQVPPEAQREPIREIRTALNRASRLRDDSRDEHLSILRNLASEATELQWQPLLTQIRQEEGSMLVGLGEYDEGSKLWEQAWFEAATASDWQSATALARDISWVASSSNVNIEKSQLWLDLATVSRSHAYDPSGWFELALLEPQVQIEFMTGNYKESEQLARQLLDRRKSLQGEDHYTTADDMGQLALALNAQGQYEEALELRKSAIRIQIRTFGENRKKLADDYMNLAQTQRFQGKYTEARANFETSYQIMKRLSPDDPRLTYAILGLASSALDTGDIPTAVRLAEEALDVATRKYGDGHPNTIDPLATLADFKRASGNHVDALKLYMEAENTSHNTLGPDNPQTLYPMGRVCILLAEHGERSEAVAKCREFEERISKLDANTIEAARKYIHMTIAFTSLNIPSDAVSWGMKAVEATENVFGKQSGPAATAKIQLAQALAIAARHDEARKTADEALAIMEGLDTLTAWDDFATILAGRAFVYAEAGEYATALRGYQDAIERSPYQGRISSYHQAIAELCTEQQYEPACE